VPGRVEFPSLLPGVYDLAIVTPAAIYLSLAVGESGGKPLDGDALAAVRKRVAEIPDFFETKQVLAAVRDGDRVRALVRKERHGKTSLPGDHVFRRWEIWTMHKCGDRWLVDARTWIWREHAADPGPPRPFRLVAELAGVKVEGKCVEVKFTVPSEEHDR
jgi:hypothetical protein